MVYDPNSPDPDHAGLSDIDQIKENFTKQRNFEAGTSEPSNPVKGMFWLDTYVEPNVIKMRNQANDGWIELFELSSDGSLSGHLADDITSSNMVHGVQQGSGNGFDADKLDGVEGAEYLQGRNVPAGHMDYTGTTIIVDSNEAQRDTNSYIVYVKLKEYTLHKTPGSTVRFYAEQKANPGTAATSVRIYKNGVFVSGTQRDHYPGGQWFEETWDISGINNGDTIELWAKSYASSGDYVYVRNFRILGKPYVENTFDQDA